MTKTQALNYFAGNVSALTRALGLKQNAFYSWDGETLPAHLQMKLERLTNYELLADEGAWSPAVATFSDEHKSLFSRIVRRLRK